MNIYQFEQDQTVAKFPINVKETSVGFLLLENQGKFPQRYKVNAISGLIGLFFTIIISVIFLFWFLSFWWFLLIVVVAYFLFNKTFRNNLIASFRFQPGEILLPSYPLHLGQEYNLTFRRRIKGNRKTKKAGQLTFKIACLERVTYKNGSDTEVEIHVIWESQPKIYSVPIGVNTYSLTSDFTIPNNLPSSFEGENNQIRWVISIEQNIPGIVEQVYSNFVFVVDPVVVA
ncbi:MAG: hypothetical protein AAFW70_26170 [Cyanobacteria bacterium J06635_10]